MEIPKIWWDAESGWLAVILPGDVGLVRYISRNGTDVSFTRHEPDEMTDGLVRMIPEQISEEVAT